MNKKKYIQTALSIDIPAWVGGYKHAYWCFISVDELNEVM